MANESDPVESFVEERPVGGVAAPVVYRAGRCEELRDAQVAGCIPQPTLPDGDMTQRLERLGGVGRRSYLLGCRAKLRSLGEPQCVSPVELVVDERTMVKTLETYRQYGGGTIAERHPPRLIIGLNCLAFNRAFPVAKAASSLRAETQD